VLSEVARTSKDLAAIFALLLPFVTDSLGTGDLLQEIDKVAVIILLVTWETQVATIQGGNCLAEA
jgi:hypothetical protein